jgi:hypothetical protein
MPTDAERVDELLTRQEREYRDAFLAFIAAVKSPTVTAQILAAIEEHGAEGAFGIVESYIGAMSAVVPRVFTDVGAATVEMIGEKIVDNALALHFDPSLPRAAQILRESKLDLVTRFTEAQRDATRQALARAYEEGTGTVGSARAFRDSIGLNGPQEAAVANYRRMLIEGDRNALRRELRDRRYDHSVARSADTGRALKPEQIDRMVEGYRRRTLQQRAETIARTEGVRATSQAALEGADQAAEQAGLQPSELEPIWNPTRDLRTRDWHASMAGQKRNAQGVFIDGHGNRLRYPGDPAAPAETVVNCRCALTFQIRPAA